MVDVLNSVNLRRTPQSEPARSDQVRNSAGGHVFAVSDETRLRRFLILGTEGGTYYTSAKELTRDNADVLVRLAETNPRLVIDTVLEVDRGNRAPKHNPLLFALALVAGVATDPAERRLALDAALEVARTGTHLFTFLGYAEQFRGWGRGLRRFASAWYTSKDADSLAYQLVKYRQREGWTHRDVLRLAHPSGPTPQHNALYARVAGKETAPDVVLPDTFALYERVTAGDIKPALGARSGLPWEALPTESLNDSAVWGALVEKGLPMTALIRQLPRLTRLGLLANREVEKRIVLQLTDPAAIKKARIHPVNVLVAQRTYASGASARGDSTWTPNRRIVDALDQAFYAAFGNVEPSGKRTLIALDVSASMGWGSVAGMPISAREASAAMALVTMATEDEVDVVGFTGGHGSNALTELSISPRQRLDDVIRTVSGLPMGPTDCALPMLWAQANGRKYDAIHVWTDSETWAGRIHPFQALKAYRETTGLDTRLVVAGTTATDFSIADPRDPGMLDVVGFDSAAPQLIADFSAGRI
jgi:60 kDa SS-A/Ro ribonucleoprotein